MNFRIPAEKILPHAPEVYLSYRGKEYPLHPNSWKSSSRLFFSSFPSSQEWKILFSFFSLSLPLFAQYFSPLKDILSEKEKASLLEGFSLPYNPITMRVLELLPSLSSSMQRLLTEKEIPWKYFLFFLEEKSSYQEEIASLLVDPALKKNIVRELFLFLLELEEEKRKLFVEKAKEYLSSLASEKEKIYLSQKYRKILFSLRYPYLSRRREEIEKKIRSLSFPSPFQIQWDPQLEKVGFSLLLPVKSLQDLEKVKPYFSSSFYQKLLSLWQVIEEE